MDRIPVVCDVLDYVIINPHKNRTRKWWLRYSLNIFLGVITVGMIQLNRIYDRENNENGERWFDTDDGS